jgi:hypothetical protein
MSDESRYRQMCVNLLLMLLLLMEVLLMLQLLQLWHR